MLDYSNQNVPSIVSSLIYFSYPDSKDCSVASDPGNCPFFELFIYVHIVDSMIYFLHDLVQTLIFLVTI